jgi:8-oxo-dGTP pyrophosphatase MutT (NUDIX family)
MLWRQSLEPILRPLFHFWFRLSRGMTLGVRGLVLDARGHVLLIQHTYVRGWYLPGGGVDPGEAAEAAMMRELVEEVGIIAQGRPKLLSVHSNHARHKGDHVLYYHIEAWTQGQATSRGEIHAMDWFAPDALPEGVTDATRRRILEALGQVPPHPDW